MTATLPNFCIDSSKSITDTNQPHFVVIQGTNNLLNCASRITIGCEDWYLDRTDRDYNDFLFSISSRFFGELGINDDDIN